MKERTLGIILGLLNIILIAVCIFFFLGKDKTTPVIAVGECNFVYEEDLPKEILYQGITAYDEEDGDLTEKVIIEKIVTDRENGKATITYGVSDEAGNVGKATRNLSMPVLTRVQFPGAGEASMQEEVQTTNEDAEETADEENTTTTEETAEDDENAVENEEASEQDEENNPNNEENSEAAEENDNRENEEESTGGNVTVVGSNNRRN